mmetsp:Transcript_28297/g.43851  ORF Transcript_28297/g.43851 Transcript_28297/m.43851 type:complete len:270 (-) Transcript_28297:65-874(-)
MSPTAFVTGANKGIGYYIAKGLATRGFQVFIGCRDDERGIVAQRSLQEEVPNAKIILVNINIDNEELIVKAAKELSEKCTQGLDILVNNAAMAYPHFSKVPFSKQAEETIRINYFGTLNICKHFIPILRKDGRGRIINISSRMGSKNKIKNPAVRDRISSEQLTIPQLNEIMMNFQKSAAAGTVLQDGWPNSAYSVSKIGVTALTRVLARESQNLFSAFAVCPGYCRTDMTSDSAPKSAEEGADTPIWLATSNSVTSGKFYADRKEIDV